METCACPGGIDIDEVPRNINPECVEHGRGRTSPEHPECCGGGSFYGHEPFCDVGHVKAERHIKSRLEALEMVASCAKDVIDYWPNMSFKTIRIMIPKMENLKQALSLLK
jgi:hypothetical protein